MNLDTLKPVVKFKAEQLAQKCLQSGILLKITSAYRSFDEQNKLYAQGRTTPGSIVTNAKAGQSYHNWRVAFDVVEMKNGKPNWNCDWNKIGSIGKSFGLEWGGDWKGFPDRPHFQLTRGYSLEDFQSNRVDEKKFSIEYEKQLLIQLIEKLKTLISSLRPA